MRGDPFRKVQSGEPIDIPAVAYNAMIDAALVNRRRTGPPDRGPKVGVQGIALACNASGATAPWHGVVELAPRTLTAAQIEFVKPGAVAGAGVYAVLLEPVAAGNLGLIALSGGPDTVLVDGAAVSCGDEIGPQDGSWAAGLTGSPAMWIAATDESDDTVKAMFLAGRSSALIIALQHMTTDDAAYNCKYLEADGTQGDTLTARRPNGIRVDNGDPGYLGQDSSGQNMFIPCHARHDQGLGLTVETRTDDPGLPEAGQTWLRTDAP